MKKQTRLICEVEKVTTEFKKQIVTAVSSAFGFLVALSWRQPISDTITYLILKTGINVPYAILSEYVSAVLVTLFAVIGLFFITKLNKEPPK